MRITEILRYLRGEWWCRFRHKPLMTSLGGYGGRDVWGRRRGAYHGVWCVVCNRRWEKTGEPRPLTTEQRAACAATFGRMWVEGEKDEQHTKD